MIALTFLVLLLISLSFVFSEISLDEGVMVLNEENFDEAITGNPSGVLVEFYAPWCGHCKSLAPEWAKAATTLAGNAIKLAKVDATEAKSLASKFEIKGFPTIKFVRGEQISDYSGGRTEADIVAWVNKKSMPAYTILSSDAEFSAFQEKHELFVLGVFSDESSSHVAAFQSLASSDDSSIFAIAYDAGIKAKLGVQSDTVIVLKGSSEFEETRADLSLANGFAPEEVKTFITGESTPLIQTFSQEAAKKIFGSPINKHTLFFTDKSAAHHDETIASMKVAAKSFKGKTLFVNVPSTEGRILEFFGLTAADLPTLILADMGAESGLKKYPFSGAITADTVSSFLTNFFAGTLTPTLKSEVAAPDDTTGPVTIVKGTTFKDIVIDNEKDVLVEFYAPWCGHCKKLAPIWDDLGAEYESNPNIVIAKMDSTANEIDVPGVSVKGFPTIIYFPSGAKANPVKYEGGRELDDLIAFIEENSSYAGSSDVEAGSDEL